MYAYVHMLSQVRMNICIIHKHIHTHTHLYMVVVLSIAAAYMYIVLFKMYDLTAYIGFNVPTTYHQK